MRSSFDEEVGQHEHELCVGPQQQQHLHQNCRGQVAKVKCCQSDIVVEWSRDAGHGISQGVSAYGSRGRCAPQHQLGVSIWVTSSIKGPRVDVRIGECCAPQPLHQWGVHPGLHTKGQERHNTGSSRVHQKWSSGVGGP